MSINTMAKLRTARNAKLSKTDHLLLSDSVLTVEETEIIYTYRLALRDLPALYTAETVADGVTIPEITGTDEFIARVNG